MSDAPIVTPAVSAAIAPPAGAEALPIFSQWTLIRRRFLRHRLATVAAVVVALLYGIVIFADFLAYSDPGLSNAQRALVPPQDIHWWSHGEFAPHVHAL